jgi:hypothetical protein
MPRFRPHDVEAWQWDGTRKGAQEIVNATGLTLQLLNDLGDPHAAAPRFLELPFGVGRPESLICPRDWLVRTPDQHFHIVNEDTFATLYEPLPDKDAAA